MLLTCFHTLRNAFVVLLGLTCLMFQTAEARAINDLSFKIYEASDSDGSIHLFFQAQEEWILLKGRTTSLPINIGADTASYSIKIAANMSTMVGASLTKVDNHTGLTLGGLLDYQALDNDNDGTPESIELPYFGLVITGFTNGIESTPTVLSYTGGAGIATDITVPNDEIVSGKVYARKPFDGISVNNFTEFSTVDSPNGITYLVNLPNTNGYDGSPADLMVISSNDDIYLTGEIRVLGAATDVLFISKTGNVECNYCEIRNVHRATFATGSSAYSLPNLYGVVGNIQTNRNAQVKLIHLNAPGVLSLDVLSGKTIITGVLNLNENVDANIQGVTSAINGNKVMATGGVNIMQGDIKWNYESQLIQKAKTHNLQHTLYGQIKAAAIKLTSSEKLRVKTKLVTTSDYRSTTRYKGNAYVTAEGVTVQSFGQKVDVENYIETAGSLNVHSNGSIDLKNNAVIVAGRVSLVARDNIYNEISVEADNIDVAANNVVNRGTFNGLLNSQFWVENNLANEYGGVITGADISILSKNGIVRNGTRLPYLLAPFDSDMMDYLVLDMSVFNDGAEPSIGYYNDTLYSSDITESFARPEKSGAFIWGKNVEIKAKALENINPYWVKIDDVEKTATLEKALVNQVYIQGDNKVVIDAEKYILNTSAIMMVNSPFSALELKSNLVLNERYRAVSVLHALDSDGAILIDPPPSTEINGFKTVNYTFSPPGQLVSMGNLFMTANTGFINNVSYLEVNNEAHFEAPIIKDLGFEDKGLQVEVSTQLRCDFDESMMEPVCVREEELIETPSDEMNSLFHIQGPVYGEQSAYVTENYQPFDVYENVIKEKLITEEILPILGWDSTDEVTYTRERSQTYSICDEWSVGGMEGDCLKTAFYEDTITEKLHLPEAVVTNNVMTVDWQHVELTVTKNSSGRVIGKNEKVLNSGKATVSTFPELEKIWNESKAHTDNLMQEINWWNEL